MKPVEKAESRTQPGGGATFSEMFSSAIGGATIGGFFGMPWILVGAALAAGLVAYLNRPHG